MPRCKLPLRRDRGKDDRRHGRSLALRRLDRCEPAAQGGCPPSPRPRHVHRRRPHAGHAGRRLRAQPDGACACAAGDQAAGGRRQRLHAGRHRRRSTSSKPDRSSPRIATAPTRRSPTTACATSASPSPPASQPTRAQAEDLADQVELELEELPAVVDCVAAMRPGSPRVFEHWPDNAYITSTRERGRSGVARLGAGPAAPPVPHEPAGDGLARMPRRAGLLGSPQRRAGGLPVDPGRPRDAARPGAGARPAGEQGPRDRARRRRRLRRQEPADAGGHRGRRDRHEGRPSGALDRGPPRASARLGARARPLLRSDHFGRPRTARCSASRARSISTPAPIRCGRPARSWKPAWRRAT